MKYLIKLSILGIMLLTSCTEKNTQKSTENQLTPAQIEEVQQIENLTDEMEKSANSIEKKAQDLDDLLNEIDK